MAAPEPARSLACSAAHWCCRDAAPPRATSPRARRRAAPVAPRRLRLWAALQGFLSRAAATRSQRRGRRRRRALRRRPQGYRRKPPRRQGRSEVPRRSVTAREAAQRRGSRPPTQRAARGRGRGRWDRRRPARPSAPEEWAYAVWQAPGSRGDLVGVHGGGARACRGIAGRLPGRAYYRTGARLRRFPTAALAVHAYEAEAARHMSPLPPRRFYW